MLVSELFSKDAAGPAGVYSSKATTAGGDARLGWQTTMLTASPGRVGSSLANGAEGQESVRQGLST